jgi:DME family drug/metabolite transporter
MSRHPLRTTMGSFFVLGAAVLWGTTGTAQTFAPASAGPVAIGVIRLMIGGVALLLLAFARGSLYRGQVWPVWPSFLAAASMAGYQLVFFAAVKQTGVALGTAVAIGSAPILAGLLGWLVRGERPTARWMVATLCAIAGCGLLVGGGGSLSVNGVGLLLAIGAGGCYAIYALASKMLVEGRPPDAVTAVAFFGGALLLTPLLFVVDLRWLTQPNGLLAALHLGLLATAAAYALYVRGLALVPTATAVTLSLGEPVVAAALGVVLLGERLSGPALAGLALLLAGLAILTVLPAQLVRPAAPRAAARQVVGSDGGQAVE